MNKIIFILLAISLCEPASAMRKRNSKIKSPHYMLMHWIEEGDYHEAEKCLRGADAHAQDAEGYTALMRVIAKHNKDGFHGTRSYLCRAMINSLIKKTTDFEIENKDGMSALGLAISGKDIPLCKALIEAGALLNPTDTSRRPPLFVATRNKKMCRFILEAKANVHLQDSNGHTALHYAVRRYSRDATKVLLAAHAAVNVQDNDSFTPLLTAAMYGCPFQCALLLANGANPYSRTKKGDSALAVAAQLKGDRNSILVCETLITKPLFLPHRTAAQMQESAQRVMATLCAFKSICPKMPRDLRYQIVLSSKELKLDALCCPLFKLHAHRYDHLPYMPLQTILKLLRAELLEPEKTVAILKQHCYTCLEPLLLEAYESIDFCPLKGVLHPDTQDATFGSQIEKNICMNLGIK